MRFSSLAFKGKEDVQLFRICTEFDLKRMPLNSQRHFGLRHQQAGMEINHGERLC
ncbi:hypothetical protein [Acinetobacter sp.]|uniref:hypothetical protein n=1 Tax=Acinetobacter sp. TaxID=472 RepID=UPI0035B3FB75